jgi:hypothetical protein
VFIEHDKEDTLGHHLMRYAKDDITTAGQGKTAIEEEQDSVLAILPQTNAHVRARTWARLTNLGTLYLGTQETFSATHVLCV